MAEISVETLANDIMVLARNSLLVNFRFLDRAVSALRPSPAKDISIATDGARLYYGPRYVLSIYKNDRNAVARAMLHSIFHCVFRHWAVGRDIDRARWDLAADIAVESLITSLDADCVRTAAAAMQAPLLAVLESELTPPLTAERIYSWLKSRNFSDEELERERDNFYGDGHGPWYGGSADAKVNEDLDLRVIWEDISKRMQTELELIDRDSGSRLVQDLRTLNRTRRSYSEFLRRFGVHGELMRLSEEEFDYNYYTYGLELYGDIPLIEPLEYSEQRRIRELVIAIDTSGSVRGEIVQSFMQHTYDILKRQDSFFEKTSVYIIQCDDTVRDAAHITCAADFDRYIEGLEIKGLGKTDFRPVFEYVDGLIRSGALSRRLRGLIYFTDGFGIFPQTAPQYDTAFVIHGREGDEPPLPPWAQRLTVTEDEILDGRFSS